MTDSFVESILLMMENCDENGEEKTETKLAWEKLSGSRSAEYDADEAVALLEECVKDGDGEAMWMLGLCKEYGLGTDQEIDKAEELYKRSKEKGNKTGKFLVSIGWCGRGRGSVTIGGLFMNISNKE